MNRRQWLSTLAAALPALAAAPAARQRGTGPQPAPAVLDLKDFQPRSMLEVPATRVPRARVPVIDFHTHLGFRAARLGAGQGEEMSFPAPPAEVLAGDGPGQPQDDGQPDRRRRQRASGKHQAISDASPRIAS